MAAIIEELMNCLSESGFFDPSRGPEYHDEVLNTRIRGIENKYDVDISPFAYTPSDLSHGSFQITFKNSGNFELKKVEELRRHVKEMGGIVKTYGKNKISSIDIDIPVEERRKLFWRKTIYETCHALSIGIVVPYRLALRASVSDLINFMTRNFYN
jgi:hypothetical protein